MAAAAFAGMLIRHFFTTRIAAQFLRMHILAADSADKACQKTAIILRTRMYTETYETQ